MRQTKQTWRRQRIFISAVDQKVFPFRTTDSFGERKCVMHSLGLARDLFAEAEQTQFTFLVSDLTLGHTFLQIAETQSAFGEVEAAVRALRVAERGYHAVGRMVTYLASADQQHEIRQKLTTLHKAIETTKSYLEQRSRTTTECRSS